MNADVLRKAQRHLSRRDVILQPLIRNIGPCTLQHNADHFAILVRSIRAVAGAAIAPILARDNRAR